MIQEDRFSQVAKRAARIFVDKLSVSEQNKEVFPIG
jgi:hypothetical protein